MKKNVVMASASGYDWTMLEPFVTSFVRNCPSAELVLFVNDLSDFTRDRLTSCGGGLSLSRLKSSNSLEMTAGTIFWITWKLTATITSKFL